MGKPYNQFLLEGRKYLVTGAASGIGKATSIILSSLGADLILVDINSEDLKATHMLCKSSDRMLVMDLSQSALIKDQVLSCVADFGKLNGLIHIAGKAYLAPLKSISEEKCADVYSLNTYAALELSKVFINRNVYTGESGAIVFVSSIYALVGSAANVGYAMTKAALHGITRSLSIELAPRGIRVNCVAPGFIKTKMLGSIQIDENHNETITKLHPLGLGDPEDVGNAIGFLLSDAAKWITGTILSVDGGYTAQ